ncbi:MAG: hypothetical protein R3B09_27175 [Nannocystaceae bacterium]
MRERGTATTNLPRGRASIARAGVALRLARALGFALAFLVGADALAAGTKTHKVPDLRSDPAKSARSRAARIKVPLTIHIAAAGEDPVATMRRLQQAIDRANEALRPYEIEVTIREIRVMPTGFDSITRRRDRRRIAHYAPVDGSVHVFMVDTLELRSGRRGDRSVRGLHWRYRGVLRRLRLREYVVVGSDAPATTLVHEIGHLFGLPHSVSDENLMCSCRRGPRQVFTATQALTLRKGARGFLGQRNAP